MVDRSVLKHLVILTLLARCHSEPCQLRNKSVCENGTCSDAHYMWERYDSAANQLVQLWCPKSEGHDVVLCKRRKIWGNCYVTQVPKGLNCANVEADVNNDANSVDPLGGCIRLYDGANCQGKWRVFVGGPSGDDLLDLDSAVTSVGLCSKEEDWPQEKCHQASPEGRARCPSSACYWLGKPNCGDNSTCGGDHFMWSGHNYPTCRNQSTKFCCPKSDGHDVVLCEHYDLKGECIVTHIPKGQTCAEVEMRDWTSSVHSLEGCIKLYQDANCKKLMTVFKADTKGHNVPAKMNDKLKSVGLCSATDRLEEGCNRAGPEGRAKCSANTTQTTESQKVTKVKLPVLSQGITTTPETCILSNSVVNGKRVCKNSLIFSDDFQNLDPVKWGHEIKIARKPDYEFVIYNDRPENVFVKDGILHLKPTVNGKNFVENGAINLDRCTGDSFEDECSRNTEFSILPPVQSARITMQQRLHFKYGLVEVQAQFPAGDWITAEIRLVPAEYAYGPQYESGLVRIISRGNQSLKKPSGENMGCQTVEGSVTLGVGTNVRTKSVFYNRDTGWQSKFHNFTILWTPEDIAFLVDGNERKYTIRYAQGYRLSDVIGLPSNENKIWSSGTSIAPFDHPFYLSLGVSVGGIRDFKDGWTNNGKSRPWSNTDPRAMLSFWKRKNDWEPTWERNSAFRIKSVKIKAL